MEGLDAGGSLAAAICGILAAGVLLTGGVGGGFVAPPDFAEGEGREARGT